MPKNTTHLPGDGLLGWMGRQIGYVKKALKTDVTDNNADKRVPMADNPRPAEGGSASAKTESQPEAGAIIYRNDTVEEAPHPEQPNMKLRRTTIDEVIVTPQTSGEKEKSD